MTELPQALAPLGRFNQFVLYILVAKANGKTTKLPVSPHTLEVSSAHDPRNWLSFGDAQAMAAALGAKYHVGFTFTEFDPFWFLDIDRCLDPATGGLTPLADRLVSAFGHAAVEVSASGTGLHIIGTGPLPAHATKWKGAEGALELYDKLRFVALTGDRTRGSADADYSLVMPDFVSAYFAPREGAGDAAVGAWSDEPVPEWSGPDDDALLLEKALRSSSAGSRFGTKASFKDLWEADADALARAFPDPAGERQYDESSADAALAQHLAFWTGKNHDRMHRMMETCALRRDKWDRPDYLPRTIRAAVAMQDGVYHSGPAPQDTPPPAASGFPATASDDVRPGMQFMSVSDQLGYFWGCCYVRDLNRVFVPDGGLLRSEQFNAVYGGYIFALDASNQKTTKKAWEVFTESQATRFPKVTGICFRPALPRGEIITVEGQTLLNTYVPIETEAEEGDISPFLDFFARILPDSRDRDILWAYMAAVVQYPGVKFQWWPFLQGVEGNGKTLIFRAVEHAVGQRYTHYPNARDLTNTFNGWLANKLFIGIEEIFVKVNVDVTEALKPVVTNDRIEVQRKGHDQLTLDNFANGMMASNHKSGMVVHVDGRRYAPFFTAQQSKADLARCGMAGEFFPRLYTWLKSVGYKRLTFALRSYKIPDALNPATTLMVAPATSSTAESVEASRGRVEQEIIEAVEQETPGFKAGWISSLALNTLLERLQMHRTVSHVQRKAILVSLGYDWPDSLRGHRGRASSMVLAEGGRPVLYALPGVAPAGYDSAQTTQAYCEAQHYVT